MVLGCSSVVLKQQYLELNNVFIDTSFVERPEGPRYLTAFPYNCYLPPGRLPQDPVLFD